MKRATEVLADLEWERWGKENSARNGNYYYLAPVRGKTEHLDWGTKKADCTYNNGESRSNTMQRQ